MALTVKKLLYKGQVVSVSWADAEGQHSMPLGVGTDQEIRDRLGADTVILPPDPEPVQKALIQQVSVEDVRTTNATQATLASWPLALQTLYTARFIVTAIDVGNADTRAWHATATAKRVNNGALLVGTPTVVSSHADAGAASWALAADVSGNTFRVRVTGAAGRTISWSVLGEIVRSRPDGLVD